MKKIAVIRLGSLAGFMLSIGHFQALRKHYQSDHLTLITTKKFESLARGSECFDEVIIDERLRVKNFRNFLRFLFKLRSQDFDIVYDFKNNFRSFFYRLFTKGQSFKIKKPRDKHIYKCGNGLLERSGVEMFERSDISFMKANVSRFDLPEKYALLVIKGDPKRRWAVENFAGLADYFRQLGVVPVLIGGKVDILQGQMLVDAEPVCVNLINKLSLNELASLARGAFCSVGSEDDFMHVIALTGCRCLTLYAYGSWPARSAPLGVNARHMRREEINDITLEDVTKILEI